MQVPTTASPGVAFPLLATSGAEDSPLAFSFAPIVNDGLDSVGPEATTEFEALLAGLLVVPAVASHPISMPVGPPSELADGRQGLLVSALSVPPPASPVLDVGTIPADMSAAAGLELARSREQVGGPTPELAGAVAIVDGSTTTPRGDRGASAIAVATASLQLSGIGDDPATVGLAISELSGPIGVPPGEHYSSDWAMKRPVVETPWAPNRERASLPFAAEWGAVPRTPLQHGGAVSAVNPGEHVQGSIALVHVPMHLGDAGDRPAMDSENRALDRTHLVDGTVPYSVETRMSPADSMGAKHVVVQVAESIHTNARTLQHERSTDFILQLDPPELGRVGVYLTASEQGIAARLVVQDDQTRVLLEERLEDLRQQLRDGGLDRVRIDVTCDQSSRGRDRQREEPGDVLQVRHANRPRRSSAGQPLPTVRGSQQVIDTNA
jgi:hypothetical protein